MFGFTIFGRTFFGQASETTVGISPSASVSPSVSPSASASPSISPSASASPSVSPSASVSPSPSPAFTPRADEVVAYKKQDAVTIVRSGIDEIKGID